MATVTGGAGVAAAMAKIQELVTNASVVNVGFLREATYPDGKPVAMIAAIQNFGAPRRNIPPRPFFTTMIKVESPGWAPLIAVQLVKTKYDAAKTMERVGAALKGQLQKSIRTGPWKPLAASTLAGRRARYKGKGKGKHDKPLIDTGHMLNSVDWIVEKL